MGRVTWILVAGLTAMPGAPASAQTSPPPGQELGAALTAGAVHAADLLRSLPAGIGGLPAPFGDRLLQGFLGPETDGGFSPAATDPPKPERGRRHRIVRRGRGVPPRRA